MTGTIDGTDLTDEDGSLDSSALPDDLSVTALTAALVEQAKGVLIFRYGVDGDAAHGLLSRWADETGFTVEDVAHALVFAICQGVQVGPSDTRLARWIEERLRHELDAAR
jgi:ANTAR domain